MSLVEVLKIIVLETVEGFAEQLPIGSTGHMILVDEIICLNQPDAFKNVLLVVTQLGAIPVVVVMYFHKLNPFSPTGTSRQEDATQALWIEIIITCVPVIVPGPLLGGQMEAHLSSAYVVATALTAYGVPSIVLENGSVRTNPRFIKAGQISAKAAFLIGTVRLLALIPGTSHSGSAILGVVVLSYSGVTVAESSLFLGIPITFGTSLLKIIKYSLTGNAFTGPQAFHTILGMLIVLVVSIYFIRLLMGYVRKHDFKFFGRYRIILGAIVLTYFGITMLTSQEQKPEA